MEKGENTGNNLTPVRIDLGTGVGCIVEEGNKKKKGRITEANPRAGKTKPTASESQLVVYYSVAILDARFQKFGIFYADCYRKYWFGISLI